MVLRINPIMSKVLVNIKLEVIANHGWIRVRKETCVGPHRTELHMQFAHKREFSVLSSIIFSIKVIFTIGLKQQLISTITMSL